MSPLTSRRSYVALGVFEAGDAVASAIPLPYVARTMDRLGVPSRVRWLVPAVKAATALGLLSVARFPRLARCTTAILALYFAGAAAVHVRMRNEAVNIVPAVLLSATFAAMTVAGPATS